MNVSNLVDWRGPANFKIRCLTCLSYDRVLKPLKEMSFMFTICPEIFNEQHPFADIKVCWECQAIILKIKQFLGRAVQAQNILKQELITTSYFNGLSTLKSTEIELITLPSNNTVTSNLIEEHSRLITIDPGISPIVHQSISQSQSVGQGILPANTLATGHLQSAGKIQPYSEPNKVELEIVKIEKRADYDLSIAPVKVEYPVEAMVTASETEVKDNDLDPLRPTQCMIPQKTIEVDSKDVVYNFLPPNVKLNYTPQVVYINTPIITTPGLRGLKEPVKVTVGNMKLEINKESNSKLPLNNESSLKLAQNNESSLKLVVNNESESKLNVDNQVSEEFESQLMDRPEMLEYIENKKNTLVFKRAIYKCPSCVETFKTQGQFDDHNRKHDLVQGELICNVCEQRFSEQGILDEHYKAHLIVFKCLKCDYKNNERNMILGHVHIKHVKSDFQCRKCSAIFPTFKDRLKHRREYHQTKVTCEDCGKVLSSKYALQYHMIHHLEEPTECTICKKKVKHMKAHMKTHESHPEQKQYCVECDMTFKNKFNLKMHLKKSLRHNSIEKFGRQCDDCGKYFAVKRSLIDHIEAEHGTGKAVYICDDCGKKFKSKGRMKRHVKGHYETTRPKLRVCEICGKCFKDKSTLAAHINNHLGNRPFECPDCGDTFTYSGSFYTHRKLKHKVKRKSEK